MIKGEVMKYRKVANNLEVINKILKFCSGQERSLNEISEHLNMNKNTLRSSYLYPMVREKQLKRTSKVPNKNTNRYYI
jgi:hypothetical protein